MPTLPSVGGPGYRWARLENLLPFWRAVRERFEAIFHYGPDPVWPDPEAGTYCCSANASTPSDPATSNYGITFLQQTIDSLTGSYLDELNTAADPELEPQTFTVSELHEQAGMTVFATLADPTAFNWRRRCPRQIHSTSDTTDADGNTVADDMVAMMSWQEDPTLRHRIYKRVSGTWIEQTAEPRPLPDILDSDEDTPDHAQAGALVQNDYVGWWLWDQMRACLVLLNKPAYTIGGTNQLEQLGTSQTAYPTGAPSWSDAKTAAEADFAGTTPGAPTRSTAEMWTNGAKGGSVYSAQIYTGQFDVTADLPGNLDVDIEIWLETRPLDASAVVGADVYDNNGFTDYLDTVWNVVFTDSRAGGSGIHSLPMGTISSNTLPVWCADPSGFPPAQNTTRGFVTNGYFVWQILTPTFTDTA